MDTLELQEIFTNKLEEGLEGDGRREVREQIATQIKRTASGEANRRIKASVGRDWIC